MNLKEERRSIYSLIYLVVIPLIVGAIIIPGCFTGCISVTPDSMDRLDALTSHWIDVIEQYIEYKASKPTTSPEDSGPGAPANDISIDAVDYGKLIWQYGGFSAAAAKLDSPRISSLRSNGRELTYKWEVGLAGWGLGHTDAGAICAVFFEQPDGRWIGGKFDWVSTSRASRELKHVESYKDWPSSGIKLPHSGRVAFVVTSANGKLRSNVLTATR